MKLDLEFYREKSKSKVNHCAELHPPFFKVGYSRPQTNDHAKELREGGTTTIPPPKRGCKYES